MSQRIFLTGATGFVGSHLVHALLARGDTLTALVRNPARCTFPDGVTRHAGDVLSADLAAAMRGHDAVIHLAADYRIGVADRAAMIATNVRGTANVLDAAIAAGVPRILHVSSTAAFGDTRGMLADETHRHNGRFRTLYEETKHIAHGLACARAASGAPVVIAAPCGVFGEGDQSALAAAIRDFCRGKLPVQIATKSRFQLCHVTRVADGLLRVLDAGRVGEAYMLTGRALSMPELIAMLARLTGRAAPRSVPPEKLRAAAALMDAMRRIAPDLPLSREALAVMDGSTYTYHSDKAARVLGWDAASAGTAFEAELDAYVATLPRA